MLRDTIIRVWNELEYQLKRSAEVPSLLPDIPVGAIELTNDELEMAAGGHRRSFRTSKRKSHCFFKKSARRSFKKSKRRSSRQSSRMRSYG